jgi:tetratricopeptide (TPR) repeat protein
MTKLASWLIAASLTMILGASAQPQPQPPAQPFRYEVREDMFRGFAGDRDAFKRAMALCEARLAENPNHAEALAWHASGLLFQAGEAFRAREESQAMALNQRALAEMARAVALRPDEIEVLVVRASSLLAAAMGTPDVERARAYAVTVVGDFEKAVALQQRQLDNMPAHPKGELFAGLAEGWSRVGDAQKARFYLTRIIAELPDTPYSVAAKARLDNPGANSQITCLGCHTR